MQVELQKASLRKFSLFFTTIPTGQEADLDLPVIIEMIKSAMTASWIKQPEEGGLVFDNAVLTIANRNAKDPIV